MKKIVYISIATLLVFSFGCRDFSKRFRILEQFDETSLSKGAIVFQRGVFRIEDDGLNIKKLCIPVNGQWKQVGDMHDCGNPPPPSQQREILPFPQDVTFLGIRNLGVSTEQWEVVQKLNSSENTGNPENAFLKVGEAFSFNVGSTDVSWRFDSQKLPEELKTQIPGSGIHVHFGGLFSDKHTLPLFDSDGGDFKVEMKLSIPTFVRSGRAHSGVTVAIDLVAKTTGGIDVTVPLIINLFSPNLGSREVISSDGRVNFVGSYLGTGNRYIQSLENQQRNAPWTGFDRFAFKVTRENVKNILTDMNIRRQTAGAELLDESYLEQVRVSGLTLRNESRFLDEGNVNIMVVVDYFRVVRENL